MRIFLLVDCYLPSPKSGAKLVHDLATEMARLGNDVAVITADDALPASLEVSRENGVTVIRVRTQGIKHVSKGIRAINEIRISGIIWNSARHFFETHPCDLVVCYSPTIFWSGLVRRLKALNACASYLIMRDLFPQWAVDAGLLSRYSPAYWYFRYHELRLYRTADVIGAQSPANLDYFARLPFQGRNNVEVLFNWTSIEKHAVSFYGVRQRFGLQDKVIFVYGGNLGVAQDIDNLLRLAGNLSDEKNVFFLLVGDGSESSRIRREIERRGMTNIVLHPAVSQADYLKIVAECDVGLITLRRDLKTHNFPGKMLGYMQQGKPILASVNPGNDLSNVIQAGAAGLACNNGEDEVLRQHALRLARAPDLRQRMGANAHRLLKEKFSVSVAACQITAHFSK